jgi:Nucleotidyl transferase AbiEii toxin, Type IV TA system
VLDLVDRLTEDLDFFVSQPGRVVLASHALIEVAANRGWAVSVLRQSDTFWRLEIVCDGEVVRVDLALDSPARLPIAPSSVGPTLAPIELAGRKLLALFDRAQPRDFVDVFELVRRFGKKAVLSAALDIDPGLDSGYLAVALRRAKVFAPTEFPCEETSVVEIVRFADDWASELAIQAMKEES